MHHEARLNSNILPAAFFFTSTRDWFGSLTSEIKQFRKYICCKRTLTLMSYVLDGIDVDKKNIVRRENFHTSYVISVYLKINCTTWKGILLLVRKDVGYLIIIIFLQDERHVNIMKRKIKPNLDRMSTITLLIWGCKVVECVLGKVWKLKFCSGPFFRLLCLFIQCPLKSR